MLEQAIKMPEVIDHNRPIGRLHIVKVKGCIPYEYETDIETYSEKLVARCYRLPNNDYRLYVTGDAWDIEAVCIPEGAREQTEVMLLNRYEGLEHIILTFSHHDFAKKFYEKLMIFLFSMETETEILFGRTYDMEVNNNVPSVVITSIKHQAELSANVPWPVVVEVPIDDVRAETESNLNVYQQPETT